MCDVGDCGCSRAACAMERAIQQEGCVTLFAGLQGGDATVQNIRRIASDILQSDGYRWASRECIHEIRQQSRTWVAFEEALKTTFAIKDSSKATLRGFEDSEAVRKKSC